MSKRPNIRINTRWRVILRDGRCRYCEKKWRFWREFVDEMRHSFHKKTGINIGRDDDFWEMDHIWPVSYGGKNRFSFFNGNLALACRSCNRRKSNIVNGDWEPMPLTSYQKVKSFILAILLGDVPIEEKDY